MRSRAWGSRIVASTIRLPKKSSRAQRQRLVRRLDAGLHADNVTYVSLKPKVEFDEKIDGAPVVAGDRREIIVELGAGGLDFETGCKLRRKIWLVRDGKLLRIWLHEKIERVENSHLGEEIDFNLEFARLLGKNQPRLPVSMRILLPVDEMPGWQDFKRIACNARPAMRRGPQPDDLGAK